MNEALKAKVETWIEQDPDTNTQSELESIRPKATARWGWWIWSAMSRNGLLRRFRTLVPLPSGMSRRAEPGTNMNHSWRSATAARTTRNGAMITMDSGVRGRLVLPTGHFPALKGHLPQRGKADFI